MSGTPEQRFGQRLRHVREELVNETRPQLAAVVDVDASTIYRWERGEGSPRAAQMAKLLRHYAKYAVYLLDGGKALPQPPTLPPLLEEFLRTPEGRKAKARGMVPMLASLRLPKSASIQTYTKVMLALWDEFGPR